MRALGIWMVLAGGAMVAAAGCGDDDGAVARGIGAECAADMDCTEMGQRCLTQFRGGYCGESACMHDTDCPTGAACITEDDGLNYCFLTCADKPECNVHRTLANESNCVGSLTFVDGTMGRKVCRPPLSGTPSDAGPGDAGPGGMDAGGTADAG